MILDEILEKMKLNKSKIAYTVGNNQYTYLDLYKYVCNIYEFLLNNNKEKRPVIVYGHKEIYMKACFLACSFAGMAYVPVDTCFPKERVEYILDQVKPEIVFGDFFAEGYKTINTNQINEIIKNDFKDITNIIMKPEDVYYMIFTSGSTGTPKGVMISYKNLDSCVNWLKEITNIGNDEIILNQANFSFDLSVADLYLSLVSGSEHFIINNESNFDFKKIFERLKNSNATIAIMTPSFADFLCLDKSFNSDLLPNLKTILFCGEKLLNSTIEKLYSRFGNLKIINSYGPTECTFAVTSIDIDRNNIPEEVPVGVVKPDCKILIVDEHRNEVKNGDIGEILILGKSVAKGYLGIKKENSFIEYNGENGYLTGDLGYKKDDVIFYINRKDKQIKYKGYRIELSEIEKVLNDIPEIEKAIVAGKTDKYGKVIRLIAIVKINSDTSIQKIKEEISKKLPEYMIPTIKIIDEFPLTQNGKCDEKKLLEN